MDNELITYFSDSVSVKIKKIREQQGAALRGVHFHSAVELVRADRGSCICVVSGESVTVSRGQVILINSRVLHQIKWGEPGAEVTYIQLDMDRYAKQAISPSERYLYMFLGNKTVQSHKLFDENSKLRRVFDLAEQELKGEERGFESFVDAYMRLIIAVMGRENLMFEGRSLDSNGTYSKIMPAIHYAEQNFKNKISLDEVCKSMNTDKYYFCKLFKKTVGATYTDFLGFLRLSSAEDMLVSTDKSVSEIAYDCGFCTLQYFNRAFKAKNGCTPKVYRSLNLRFH